MMEGAHFPSEVSAVALCAAVLPRFHCLRLQDGVEDASVSGGEGTWHRAAYGRRPLGPHPIPSPVPCPPDTSLTGRDFPANWITFKLDLDIKNASSECL